MFLVRGALFDFSVESLWYVEEYLAQSKYSMLTECNYKVLVDKYNKIANIHKNVPNYMGFPILFILTN